MRLRLILLLLLLVSCAETPPKPTTSGGSSSGSGKVVTATSEDPHECDSDLILEPHLPEECLPDEPPKPVVQRPVEPPKPDPIVGTYQIFYLEWPTRQYVYRVFANGWDSHGLRWERNGSNYRFFQNSNPKETKFNLAYSPGKSDPNIVMQEDTKYVRFEGIKKSHDPNFLFDFYVLALKEKRKGESNYFDLSCINIGRKERPAHGNSYSGGSPPNFAETLQDCEAICPAYAKYSRDRTNTRALIYTCPQDRRVSQQDFVGTYVIERNVMAGWDSVLRVERDGTATIMGRGNYTWSVTNGEARFHWGFSRSPTFEKGDLAFSIGIRGSRNEREFRQTFGSGWEDFSPVKESDDPNHQFDFYVLRHGKDRPDQGGTKESWCSNIGREEISGFPWGWSKGAPPTTSRDILECLDSCVELRDFYAQDEIESATKMYCP